jgi:hypothetical protein
MSDRIGPVALGKRQEMVFLGRELGEERNYSEQTAREIDEEVRTIIRAAYGTAEQVLSAHRERLVFISEKLIEQEALEGPEFENLFTMPLPVEGVRTAVLLPALEPAPAYANGSNGVAVATAQGETLLDEPSTSG